MLKFRFQDIFIHIVGFVAAESLEDALKQLYLIDAIDENGLITKVGRTMAGIKSSSDYEMLCQ